MIGSCVLCESFEGSISWCRLSVAEYCSVCILSLSWTTTRLSCTSVSRTNVTKSDFCRHYNKITDWLYTKQHFRHSIYCNNKTDFNYVVNTSAPDDKEKCKMEQLVKKFTAINEVQSLQKTTQINVCVKLAFHLNVIRLCLRLCDRFIFTWACAWTAFILLANRVRLNHCFPTWMPRHPEVRWALYDGYTMDVGNKKVSENLQRE